jgi:hypothetical protein
MEVNGTTEQTACSSRPRVSPSLPRRELGLALLLGCVLALFMHLPLPLYMATRVPKDAGDTLAEAWQMAWDGHAILHQPLDFSNSNQFYPAANTRAYVDGLFGYLPASVIGSGPTAAIVRLNLMFLFAYGLAFVAAYLLGRELGLRPAAAVVVGAAFAYAPYRLEHDAELNILSTGGIPLALFLGLRGYRRRSPGLVLAAWLVAAWQVTLSFNLALPFGYALAVLGVIAACSWRRIRGLLTRRVAVATLAGALLLLLIDGVVAVPYWKVRQEFGPRPPELVAFYSTGPVAFLAASRANLVWGRATAGARSQLGWEQEETLFPGVAILGLSVVGLLATGYSRPLRWGLAGGAAMTGWLALGFPLHGSSLEWPYRLLYDYLPGWNSVRVPERIWIIPMLALALLAGAGAAAVLRRLAAGRRQMVLAVALAGIVLIEGSGFRFGGPGSLIHLGLDGPHYIGGPPTIAVPPEPPGEHGLPGPQLHLPLQIGEQSSPRVVFWSTDGFPKVSNGIGSEMPHTYRALMSQMRGFPDQASVRVLRKLGYRLVVLHPQYVVGTPWAHAAGRSVRGLGLTRQARAGVIVYWLGKPSA